nr:hypothetical protein CFP56_33561 [Quercus suber]
MDGDAGGIRNPRYAYLSHGDMTIASLPPRCYSVPGRPSSAGTPTAPGPGPPGAAQTSPRSNGGDNSATLYRPACSESTSRMTPPQDGQGKEKEKQCRRTCWSDLPPIVRA